MPSVRLLPPELVNQIAAGEVIVRPASAIKELVENSLDAGATRVAIEITNGCRDLIVADDGCGMDRGDAEMALVRHATSKIASLDDLERVRTCGFRGEAVPSMASVGRMTILTRTADALQGTLIEVEGGRTARVEAQAAPQGTRIELRDLFYNVPARRKFLKSPAAEMNQVLSIVTRLALAHPSVGFSLHVDGRERLNVRSGATPRQRAGQMLGTALGDALLEVDAFAKGRVLEGESGSDPAVTRVHGLLAPPALASKTRAKQFLFANGRPITHRRLPSVIQEAFRGVLMVGRYPVFILFIDVPPELIDVNVHPTKEEVRFAEEDLVCSLVFHAVRDALAHADLRPALDLGSAPNDGGEEAAAESAIGGAAVMPSLPSSGGLAAGAAVDPGYRLTPEQLRDLRSTWISPSSYSYPPRTGGRPASRDGGGQGDILGVSGQPATPPPPRPVPVFEPGELEPTPEAVPRHLVAARSAEVPFFQGPPPKALGQTGLAYILAEVGDDLLIIDQHAGHERLLYHYFSTRPINMAVQTLLVPLTLDLPPGAALVMETLQPVLARLGVQVESFGGNTYNIATVPADLPNIDIAAVVGDLLADFEQDGNLRELGDLRDRVATRMACRAAVKAGQVLSLPEMNRLLLDMREARLPFTCPHGRPTMLLLTRDQLDRQFGRMG